MDLRAHPDYAAALDRESERYPTHLVRLPHEAWPPSESRPEGLIDVWRSRTHLVQIYRAPQGHRLSIIRAALKPGGHRWEDGISWDDMQRLKSECGYGDRWAVELFPPDDDVVDVANMRHLWILPQRPRFGWARKK